MHPKDMRDFPVYRLHFDDIEELFLNKVSMKSFVICGVFLFFLTMATLMILLYRSSNIFLACFIPSIYSLAAYDFIQFCSLLLLKYNLWNLDQKHIDELCRWPYYLKATSEAGQSLTIILLLVVRRQKLRYFFKQRQLPDSSRIHSRAITFVILLFIVYTNNWITHLKVVKTHIIKNYDSNSETVIEEYPIILYKGENNTQKPESYEQFRVDLSRYAHQQVVWFWTDSFNHSSIPETSISNYKDENPYGLYINIPFPKNSHRRTASNRTQKTHERTGSNSSRPYKKKSSYLIDRCTFGQQNFFLASFIPLIFNAAYFILICFFLKTIYQERIPTMTVAYHKKLHDRDLSMGRVKSADRHQQLILLAHLKQFQYLIVFCHTAITLIRLIYVFSVTIVLAVTPSPLQWPSLKFSFHALFIVVYYSIPIRILLLFLYLFFTVFSQYIYSIFYYAFYTKLHFSCQLEKPSIRFGIHVTPYKRDDFQPEEQLTNSLTLDLNPQIYEDHSTLLHSNTCYYCNETEINCREEQTINVVAVIHCSESTKSVI